MYRIQLTGQAGAPSPLMFHAKGQLLSNVVIEHPGALNNHKVWADFTYPVT